MRQLAEFPSSLRSYSPPLGLRCDGQGLASAAYWQARRNEFQMGNRTLLGYGGTFSIESPQPYSAVAKKLIELALINVPHSAAKPNRIDLR